MPSNPTLGAGLPKTLAAGQAGDWFDMRPFAGSDVPLNIVVAGGGTGALEGSNDPSQVKSDVQTIENYAASTFKALAAPLPSFMRVRNTGGAGTVTYCFGHAKNAKGEPCQVTPQTFDTPRTGAFSV